MIPRGAQGHSVPDYLLGCIYRGWRNLGQRGLVIEEPFPILVRAHHPLE